MVDTELRREVVARYFHRAGYATETAADGALAADAATALHPDLVVLDVKLSRVDGLEVMRRLRAEDPARPAVIMLSGTDDAADRISGSA
ncbi:MAG: response regulator [Solirubrobacterales bacterium]|nr:response regulator [Solirubrobacterales bacterium]MBV9422661.1 response regulator [Solirubrobacterales bacterium]MBV9799787.1 response regulator [Solirubrobacterales bacterium]